MHNISSVASDCGVEYGLSDFPQVDVERVFPFWGRGQTQPLEALDSVDGSLPGVDSFETYTAHFASSLTVRC